MRAFRNIRDEMREAILAATQPIAPAGDHPMRLSREGGEEDSEGGTNIKPWMAASFAELVRAAETDAPFALISCRVNGEPSATIALTKPAAGDRLMVMPLFVAVTPSMAVTEDRPPVAAKPGDG